MTTDEYRELIAFLGTKFGEVDTQFQAVGDRLQRVETGLADVRRDMFEFRGEVDDRFRVFRAEVAAGFAEVKDLLRVSHAGLDRRVKRLEEE